MRHARKDYERIQDPAAMDPLITGGIAGLVDILKEAEAVLSAPGVPVHLGAAVQIMRAMMEPAKLAIRTGVDPIGVDEPVFLIRAKDAAAPAAIRVYAAIAAEVGAKSDLVDACLDWARVVSYYQERHGCKVPDL